MKLTLPALSVCLLLMITSPGLPGAELKPIVINHVTVIDTRTGAANADLTVVVVGEKIKALGPAVEAPSDARVIDGKDKFLIPGLWDMHVHLREEGFLGLLAANGITGVREMGNDPSQISRWRRMTADGKIIGPRIVMAGLIMDGPEPMWPTISDSIKSESDARKAVQNAKKNGWDFIKVYQGLTREAYFAILDEAKRQGLIVAGHVPSAITAGEASDAGQKSIEHFGGVLIASGRDYSNERASALFAKFVKNGTWQDPTLVVKHALAYINELQQANDERLKYIPARLKERWDPERDFRLNNRPPQYFTRQKNLFAANLELVRAMSNAGVKFLAGTDLGNPYIFPGFSLHDELALLVSAGLTPLEALQTATINPAEFLGLLDSHGTVEIGKTADLVLLEANPVEEINNVRKIAAVFVRGQYLGQAELKKILSKY